MKFQKNKSQIPTLGNLKPVIAIRRGGEAKP
jgi:hypothetical protein